MLRPRSPDLKVYLHRGAPGQTWCFQRVKFPPRQEVQPPHRESSLGSEEVTNRTKPKRQPVLDKKKPEVPPFGSRDRTTVRSPAPGVCEAAHPATTRVHSHLAIGMSPPRRAPEHECKRTVRRATRAISGPLASWPTRKFS